ncbi:MAG: methyltransferase domain-containing protein [Proteobacteria bacterium]|nr:methyltransferase domain-containing protein [Pseudomonadota bacterium]
MGAGDTQFRGNIAAIYERLLVPLLFEPYAADLASRATRFAPRRLLETAAGTGAVTARLAAALDAGARITATDLNEPMLEVARAQHADPRISWRQADAQALPFSDAGFDAVVCQFGAMFFPDKLRAYREARRVLAPGGHFHFNVWNDIADNEFAQEVTAALAPLFPSAPPRFLARTPHGYHDAAAIRTTLAAAGFAQCTVDVVEHISRAASARDVAVAYCQGTPVRNEIEQQDGARLEEATQAAEHALRSRFGSGTIEGRISALVFCCA